MKNNGPWLAALALAAAMPVAAAEWNAMRDLDRMTGDEKVLGVYALTIAEEPRPSVYDYIYGMLIILCDGAASFQLWSDAADRIIEGFMPPGTEDLIDIRVRFDNETVQELSAYTFGRTNLVFVSADMLSLAEGRRRLLIEVPSVEGDLYFDFDLGFTLHAAHRKHCGLKFD